MASLIYTVIFTIMIQTYKNIHNTNVLKYAIKIRFYTEPWYHSNTHSSSDPAYSADITVVEFGKASVAIPHL